MSIELSTVVLVALAVVASLAMLVVAIAVIAFSRAHRQLMVVVVAMAERKHIHRLMAEGEERTAEARQQLVPPPRSPGNPKPPDRWQQAPDHLVPNGQPTN